jgi:hypothetical protein
METTMAWIRKYKDYRQGGPARLATLRRRLIAGVKWWTEHQAWPATDEIRIDRNCEACS